MSLGNERKIAEIQWKSGGPGLFFGIQDTFIDTIPSQPVVKSFSKAGDNFYDLLVGITGSAEATVVNAVRDVWFNGEAFLKKNYNKRGLYYFPLDRKKLAEKLIKKKNGYFILNEKGTAHKIDFLNGQGFTQFFPEDDIVALAQATIEKKLWIETPLNYLYRQKWMLALPFMNEYKDIFEDRLRTILIPTDRAKYLIKNFH